MKLLCINTNQHKLNIYTVLNRYIHCLLHLYVQFQHAKSIASKSPLKSGQSRSELSHKIYSVPSSTFIMQHFLNSDNSVFSSDNDTHPNSCAQVLTPHLLPRVCLVLWQKVVVIRNWPQKHFTDTKPVCTVWTSHECF